MAVIWSIANVEWEAIPESATDVLLTYTQWGTTETVPNPEYDSQDPMSGPEFLTGIQTGKLDFRYDNHVFTRAQTEAATQSTIVGWVQTKLGVERVALIEQATTDDLNEILLPSSGAFVPQPDP